MKLLISLLFIINLIHLHAQVLNSSQGWSLFGAIKDIDKTEFDKDCIESIWKYDSKQIPSWQVYFPNRDINLDNSIVTNLEKIKSSEGFWVNSNSLCTIYLNEDKNNYINLTQLPKITLDNLDQGEAFLTIFKEFPISAYSYCMNYLFSTLKKYDLYYTDKDFNCKNSNKDFSYCKEIDFNKYYGLGYGVDSYKGTQTATLVVVNKIENYVKDEINSDFSDTLGKEFYILEKENDKWSYTKLKINNLNSGGIEYDYYELSNNFWQSDSSYDYFDLEFGTYSLNNNNLVTTLSDPTIGYFQSNEYAIVKKSDDYWIIKIKSTDSTNSIGVLYKKWYTKKPEGVITPSILN